MYRILNVYFSDENSSELSIITILVFNFSLVIYRKCIPICKVMNAMIYYILEIYVMHVKLNIEIK